MSPAVFRSFRVASAGMTAPEFATATEREALCGFLDLQRAALIRKVQGAGDADARRAPTASSLSLLGLLKHCALWERRWFQNIVAGRSFPGEALTSKPPSPVRSLLSGTSRRPAPGPRSHTATCDGSCCT
jgi:hypothetical protein